MSGAEALVMLGAISSIIGIIEETKKVYDAATNAQGLPKAFREVALRLPIVQNILDTAKQGIEDINDDSCKGVKDVVSACEEKAKKLELLFRKSMPVHGTPDVKRYYKAVRALGKESEVEILMKGILEDVQLMACERGMKTANRVQQEQITTAIAEVSAVSPSVPEHELQETGFTTTNFGHGTQNNYNARGEYVAQGGGRQYISGGGWMSFGQTNFYAGTQNFSVSRPQEDEANACLRTIFLTNPRDDREELVTTKGPRVDGTCEWIKGHHLFNSWLRSQSQLLWLSGGPGKGKTMLSIFLAEELERTARVAKSTLFLQYFCDNKDEKRNTAITVLRGLIHQLLRARSELFEYILPSFREQREALFTFETLWRIFASMVRDPALETTYCILDGLDECDETSLEMLLGKFVALFSAKTNQSSASHFNLLIVSRDYPDFIPELLSNFPSISLDPDADSEVSQDIDRFIKVKIKELSTRKKYSEELCAHVKKVFSNRAEGTFLWIGIAAHALRKYKATEVEVALNLLPPGLDALYARILLQIDSHRREIAAKILRWVVMAVRPLTLSELSTAIETTARPSSVPFTRDERIREQISYCGHLIMLKEDRIGLVHQSAKEYLLRKTPDSNAELEIFRVKEEVANHEIARRCLDYMQSGALKNLDAFENWTTPFFGGTNLLGAGASTFLSYAMLNWHEHARSLAQSDEIFDLSHPFFHAESRTRALWLEAYWGSRMSGRPPRSFTLLHFASCFGILPLAERLISTKIRTANLTEKRERSSILEKVDSSNMTALMWAAERGYEAIVRLLLENGANIEAGNEKTALIWAAWRRHEAVVQLLIDKEANIEAGNGKTALLWAAQYGDEAMVQLLLKNGAAIETQRTSIGRESKLGKGTKTALMEAARYGHEAVVRLLLKNEADIRAKGICGETALSKAVREGREAMVRPLLKEEVDIETKKEIEAGPLMIAAYHGHEAVLQLLLERHPDTEMKYSALKEAIRGGQEVIVRLLLEKGTDISAKNKDGKLALMMTADLDYPFRLTGRSNDSRARSSGYLLSERGADINTTDKDGETELMKAAVSGSQIESGEARLAVVQLLYEKGVDTDAKDKLEETALMKVAGLDKEANYWAPKFMVWLLLEKGADVNAQNIYGETALMKAAKCSNVSKTAVIQLLLEKGANIQAVTNLGLTALMKAVRRGYKGVVLLLLKEGADVNAKDIYGETALMKAAEYGYKSGEAVVQLILEYGAYVEAVDRNGETALMWAQRKGHEGVVRLLTTG